jgi:hypothetical protein
MRTSGCMLAIIILITKHLSIFVILYPRNRVKLFTQNALFAGHSLCSSYDWGAKILIFSFEIVDLNINTNNK